MVVLLLICALVIDVGYLFYRRVHLQNAADAAALAAATEGKKAENAEETNEEGLKKVADEYITLHGIAADDDTLDFKFNESTTTVTVIITADEPLFFGPLVKIDHWNIYVQSSAAWFDDVSFSGVKLIGQDN